LAYEYKGYKPPKNGWAISLEKMKQFDKEERLHFPKDKKGRIQRRRFLDELQGKAIQNVWDDIGIVSAHSSEKISYPTQKPEALLQRIIEMASNEGDMVLDPFMGGGTTVAVAERLGRHFIGIDQSAIAIKVTELRLQKQMDMFSASFSTELYKYSYNKLRYEEPFEFEEWMVRQVGGIPNVRKRGDFGTDAK
jgi:DNA modification methylase